MRILGIDPGLARTGYGIIEAEANVLRLESYGVVVTVKGGIEYRLSKIYSDLVGIIEDFGPDELAVEELFFSRNRKTAMAVSQARGVILLACVHKGLGVFEYKPVEVKQAISGYGAADKFQVIRMLSYVLSLSESVLSDDAADALAIAVCHANRRGGGYILQ